MNSNKKKKVFHKRSKIPLIIDICLTMQIKGRKTSITKEVVCKKKKKKVAEAAEFGIW